MFISTPTEERFWAKVEPEPMSGCWLWIGARCPLGYGGFWLAGRVQKAPRVSWQLYRGRIPGGADILHRCDNPPCVNPAHLFVGDAKANMADMFRKGRQPSRARERNGRAKLTEQEIAMIRARVEAGANQRALAKEYGMNHNSIWAIVHYKRWPARERIAAL